jgi:hypothetical protein
METEEWKSMDVLGFSNYRCSTSGKVFNVSTNKILGGCSDKNGITDYSFTNDEGERKKMRKHILISKLFTDPLTDPKNFYTWVPLLLPELAISGLERYKICDEGKILSTKGEIMKTSVEGNAISIKFKINNNNYSFRVHMLVAMMFIPNPDNLKYVRFKDGNFINIHKDNLLWADNKAKTDDPPDEIWEPLKEFPKYQINPKGVRNSITHEMLNPSLSTDGYLILVLYLNNIKTRSVHVHVLMATQYIPNPDPINLIEVNHKNGIKTDFRIQNLEWVTHKENVQHAVDTGLRSKVIGNGRHIELLNDNHEVIKTFLTSDEAATYVGFSASYVKNYMKSNKVQDGIAIMNNYILRYKVEADLEGEIWKNVNTLYKNINNKYKVSNYGRIKNNKNKILTPALDQKGYGQIKLSNYNKDVHKSSDGLYYNLYIHVLVAYAFLEFNGNRDEYQVNHKDKNPRNNNIDNLEILLTKDHCIKDKGKPVLCVTEDNRYYLFPSQSDSAFLPEMEVQSIHRSIKNGSKYKTHYWYNLASQEAQSIIEQFKLNGINSSIPPKIKMEK